MKKSLADTIRGNLSEAIASPAAAFISSAPAAHRKGGDEQSTAAGGIPEGMRLVKETKSRRVHILMRPTLHGRLERAAKAEGVSVNEKLNAIIEAAKQRGEI